MFSEIKLHRWRQFNNVHLKFDERMTVLTGENGSGKTTILNILSRHFGWNLQFISTLLPLSKERGRTWWSDIWDTVFSGLDVQPGSTEVGTIKYASGGDCKLVVEPRSDQAQYVPRYINDQHVSGLHIPSHQPAFTYNRITNIPTDPQSSQQHYQAYNAMLQQYFTSNYGQNPGMALKQSLISLAVFGYGNQAVIENREYIRMFEQFQDILRILLPKVLGFQKLEIRMPDIVLVTRTGDFSLDASSGGISAIVGMAWQIFMYSQNNNDFVVTIDEPESHLHPSMQRELLPDLTEAFPHTQFIISTHSPFIVTSSSEARVYALVFDENRRVNSQYLETAELSGTANETLREILGVPITVPIWVEKNLLEILEKYKNRELTSEVLRELKKELVSSNLGFLLPDALKSLGGDDAQRS
jgi:predicted ATPase